MKTKQTAELEPGDVIVIGRGEFKGARLIVAGVRPERDYPELFRVTFEDFPACDLCAPATVWSVAAERA